MYVVIMGGGKVGEYLATTLLSQGNEVALLEKNAEAADRLSVELEGRYLIINGDGCDSDFQEDAGIRKADIFAAVTGHDEDNLVACRVAQRVFNVPRCIARVNNPKNRQIFRKVGIESVSSTMLIANMIEEEALMGGVGVVSALGRGDIVLMEMAITARMRGSTTTGIPVDKVKLPEGSMIIAVDRREYAEAEIATPATRLRNGDKAVIVTKRDVSAQVREAFAQL